MSEYDDKKYYVDLIDWHIDANRRNNYGTNIRLDKYIDRNEAQVRIIRPYIYRTRHPRYGGIIEAYLNSKYAM